MGFITGLTMYQLQSGLGDFQWRQITQTQLVLFIGIIASVIIVLTILSSLATKGKVSFLNSNYRPEYQRRRTFSVFTLRRIARSLGLDKEKTKMLEFVLRNDYVSDPVRSLNSPTLLDRHFKRAFNTIMRTVISDKDKNNRLSVLFATRNLIDTNMSTITTTSTRQIPEGTTAVLTISGLNYQTRVISSQGEALVVLNPLDSSGAPLHLARGSKASLSFFTKTSRGFSVDSRILGISETAGGQLLQLVHTGQIKKLSNRRFRRRQTVISTAFYFVFEEETARKKEKKMIVDKRMFSGSILDISIGGCSIKTSSLVSSGQRMKIEFNGEDNSVVVALGEVLRTEKSGIFTILHVRFLKIPRKSLNAINAMVYEYADR